MVRPLCTEPRRGEPTKVARFGRPLLIQPLNIGAVRTPSNQEPVQTNLEHETPFERINVMSVESTYTNVGQSTDEVALQKACSIGDRPFYLNCESETFPRNTSHLSSTGHLSPAADENNSLVIPVGGGQAGCSSTTSTVGPEWKFGLPAKGESRKSPKELAASHHTMPIQRGGDLKLNRDAGRGSCPAACGRFLEGSAVRDIADYKGDVSQSGNLRTRSSTVSDPRTDVSASDMSIHQGCKGMCCAEEEEVNFLSSSCLELWQLDARASSVGKTMPPPFARRSTAPSNGPLVTKSTKILAMNDFFGSIHQNFSSENIFPLGSQSSTYSSDRNTFESARLTELQNSSDVAELPGERPDTESLWRFPEIKQSPFTIPGSRSASSSPLVATNVESSDRHHRRGASSDWKREVGTGFRIIDSLLDAHTASSSNTNVYHHDADNERSSKCSSTSEPGVSLAETTSSIMEAQSSTAEQPEAEGSECGSISSSAASGIALSESSIVNKLVAVARSTPVFPPSVHHRFGQQPSDSSILRLLKAGQSAPADGTSKDRVRSEGGETNDTAEKEKPPCTEGGRVFSDIRGDRRPSTVCVPAECRSLDTPLDAHGDATHEPSLVSSEPVAILVDPVTRLEPTQPRSPQLRPASLTHKCEIGQETAGDEILHQRSKSDSLCYVPSTPSTPDRLPPAETMFMEHHAAPTVRYKQVTEGTLLPGGPETVDSAGVSDPTSVTRPSRNVSRSSIILTRRNNVDMRRVVMQSFIESEQSYVSSLESIMQLYVKPLWKVENSHLIDLSQVEVIFGYLPEILAEHKKFRSQLISRFESWSREQIVGDLVLDMFQNENVSCLYSSFVGNFQVARTLLRRAIAMRPLFAKFLEHCGREHKDKLSLQDLLIMPIQRVPRYSLILKDMTKHTAKDHADFPFLVSAADAVRHLAERMNQVEARGDQEDLETTRLRELELHLEGSLELIIPGRRFIRQDLVEEQKGVVTKKDRCLYLFSDLLVCAVAKKRTPGIRRGSLNIFSNQLAHDMTKFKKQWKAPLHQVEIYQDPSEVAVRRLDEDMNVLRRIKSLSQDIVNPHQDIDVALNMLMDDVNLVFQHNNIQRPIQASTRLDLLVHSGEAVERYQFDFLSSEIRHSWEEYFEINRKNAVIAMETFPLSHFAGLPLARARSGTVVTCACSTIPPGFEDSADPSKTQLLVIWSYKMFSQLFLVGVHPQPQLVAALSTYSYQVSCIACVPGSKLVPPDRKSFIVPSQSGQLILTDMSTLLQRAASPPSLMASETELSPQNLRQSMDSTSEEEESEAGLVSSEDRGSRARMLQVSGSLSPDASITTEYSTSSLDPGPSRDTMDSKLSMAKNRRKRFLSMPSLARFNVHDETRSSTETPTEDLAESLIWMGTTNGDLLLYSAQDLQNARKPRVQVPIGVAVTCVAVLYPRVFVGLASSSLLVFGHTEGRGWDIWDPMVVLLGNDGDGDVSIPVSNIAAHPDRLWCSTGPHAHVLKTQDLNMDKVLAPFDDPTQLIGRMAVNGPVVCVSNQSSMVVQLFNVVSLAHLASVDLMPTVQKVLLDLDPIIVQHKLSCLRVTSLTSGRDHFFTGTSAGVVVSLALPSCQDNAPPSSPVRVPKPQASPHGHSGQSRCLAAVFLPVTLAAPSRASSTSQRSKKLVGRALSTSQLSVCGQVFLVSGGEGFDDFRLAQSDQCTGEGDNTNHLLFWKLFK